MKIVRTKDYVHNLNFQSAMLQKHQVSFGKPKGRFIWFTRESNTQRNRLCRQVCCKYRVLKKKKLPMDYRETRAGVLFMEYLPLDSKPPVNGSYRVERVGYSL